MIILDFFEDCNDFEEALANAEDNAKGRNEVEFVFDLRDRYEEYMEDTFLTEKQFDWLMTIAER